MHRFISIFFLFIFILVTFQDVTFYAVFKLNQDFLIEKFCVNKEKKEMHCKASCHYSKQLEKQKQEDEKKPLQFPRFEVLYVFTIIEALSKVVYQPAKLASFYIQNIQDNYSTYHFRPPQFV